MAAQDKLVYPQETKPPTFQLDARIPLVLGPVGYNSWLVAVVR